MFNALKKKMRDQRGLTLIELLAVVVILGIIAAIAVPSIGALIENSKKDAHLANAQQMANSARLAVSSGDVTFTSNPDTITLEALQTKGYLEGTLKNPSDSAYHQTESLVTITKTGSKYTYSVTLKNTATSPKTHLNGDPSTLTRTQVTN